MIHILIPAYQPDEKLIDLIAELGDAMPILVVDDGSRESTQEIFHKCQEMGATVLHHEVNRGKGAAIKTGLKYLMDIGADGVITADSDGQHTPEDIRRIAQTMEEMPGAFITGGRDFSKMPLRSQFGNVMTYWVFALSTRIRIRDTQTGLRGMPSSMFEKAIEVEGDRYEYEMNVLLKLREWDVPYKEIPISTVYIQGNKSSHFQPFNDGFKVFLRVIEYALSSLSCTFVDYIIYILLLTLGKLAVPLCFAIARICSSMLNYQLNCRIVFKGKPTKKSAGLYALLVILMLGAGSTAVTYLTSWGIGEIWAKVMTDVVMFTVNYVVQRYLIFGKPKTEKQ